MFCDVEDCLRNGEVALTFPAQHDNVKRVNESAFVCLYHAAAFVELMRERGAYVHVGLEKPKRVALNRTNRPRRYPKHKPHDNTE